MGYVRLKSTKSFRDLRRLIHSLVKSVSVSRVLQTFYVINVVIIPEIKKIPHFLPSFFEETIIS